MRLACGELPCSPLLFVLQLDTARQQVSTQSALLRQVGEKVQLQAETASTVKELAATKEKDLMVKLQEVRRWRWVKSGVKGDLLGAMCMKWVFLKSCCQRPALQGVSATLAAC